MVSYKSGNHQLVRGLAEIVSATCLPQNSKTLLVPVPTSVQKIKQRQIDTVGFLAKKIQTLNRNHTVANILYLKREVSDQVGLSALARQQNLIGAIGCKSKLNGAVILLDDVITTGATISAAAKALKDAGAKSVTAIALCNAGKLH